MPQEETLTNRTEAQRGNLTADAVVIGGGLAGLAASIHLVRGGLRVICLEPRVVFRQIVGESLDWSAPDLLARLGLSPEDLIATESATWKRHVTIVQPDGSRREYLPGAWLSRPPLRVETTTLHLDRQRVHAALQRAVDTAGVVMLHEKAVALECQGKRISSLDTSRGRKIRAAWFVDASGSAASLLAREFQLPAVTYGPRKVCIWSHVPTQAASEGTTLSMLNPSGDYMQWIWEIPIRPGVNSVGYVAPGRVVKAQRARGLGNAEILLDAMRHFARFERAVQSGLPEPPAATSFLCRTLREVCGKNWVIIGEAASQSDPITGNGVTAALRHAAEASALLLQYRRRVSIPFLARRTYNLRVLEMGRFFNGLIENIFYECSLRRRLGLFAAGRVYTVPAWVTNLAYSRLRPRGLICTALFCSALATLRLAAWVSYCVSEGLERYAALRTRSLPQARGGRNALQLVR